MADFDIQIKGGTIVDGTRVPRYHGDVWIKDGKVAQLGGRAPGFAKKVIDRREADGRLTARIEGENGGNACSEDYPYRRPSNSAASRSGDVK